MHNPFGHLHMCYSFDPTIWFHKKHKCFLHHLSPLLQHIIVTLLCLEVSHSNCLHCVHFPSIVLTICLLHLKVLWDVMWCFVSYTKRAMLCFLHCCPPLLDTTLTFFHLKLLHSNRIHCVHSPFAIIVICSLHLIILCGVAQWHVSCAKRVPLCFPHCQGRFLCIHSLLIFCFCFFSCVSTLNCVLYICSCIPLLFSLK